MKIKKHEDGKYSLEVKRLYLPFVLETDCHTCGKKLELDLENRYLSYPTIDEPVEVSFYCEDCDTKDHPDYGHCYEKIILSLNLKEYKEEE